MAAPEYSPAYPPAPSAPYGAQPGQPQYPPVQSYGNEQGYYPAAADKPAQPGYPHQPSSGYQPYPAQLQGGAPPAYQQSSTNTTVVVAQQPGVVAHTVAAVGIKPNNYLVLSIINLLFCFFILGLIALIFSLQVDSAWTSGRYDEARRSSNTARILNYIGIGVGIAVWVFVGIGVIIRIVFSVAYYS